VACKPQLFNRRQAEGLFKTTGSNVRWKTDNISETVRVSTTKLTDRKWYMAYGTTSFPMAVNGFQRHSSIASHK